MSLAEPRTMLEQLVAGGCHTWQELEGRFGEHARYRGERVTVSWRQLQRIAAGAIARPRPAVARVLADMFDVTIDELLGPPSTPDVMPGTEVSDEMRRREFLAGVAVASVGAAAPQPLGRLLDGLNSPLPRRVGMTDVAAVEAAADAYMRFDLARSGDLALSFGRLALSWSTELLRLEMEQPTKERLGSAIALLADRMGWSMFDSGCATGARQMLTFALDHAARGVDPDLRAHIMLDLSTVMADSGNPMDGVDILRAALGDERLSPVERANLHAVCARHCAAAGQHAAGLNHVRLADESFASVAVRQGPDWARRITSGPGHIDSALGLALFALGDTAGARLKLGAAVRRLDRGRTRTGLRCRIRLAVLDLQQGARSSGEAAGNRIIRDAAGVTSARVRNDVVMLRRQAIERGAHDLAADLGRLTSA